MTVRLRAHHLLCMLTYVGKGYTPGFTVNYDRVAKRLSGGEEIEIVSGPDDICAPLLNDETAHCFRASVNTRDANALSVVTEWLGETFEIGSRIKPDKAFIEKLRSGFQQGSLRTACSGCEWMGLCDRVSASNFCGVKVAPQTTAGVSR
ncbi:hypothetical protein GGQ73_000966 [Rhizobium skierniewicense]|uniref:DUF1284 domain-containing protein n=1 Tax=Rhizobium skierniewicense TaxID=984260 RepID=A0A7W6C585_9HYPH|nr:DUF1284 domain-containing protein [Rhizobium skierniewicense]MBB3945041.1 hypothetical protein [Rhizobium skierniewicense]NTF31100.1 DUF1284 domain-containing protein [Rhizobium skierniewicense]